MNHLTNYGVSIIENDVAQLSDWEVFEVSQAIKAWDVREGEAHYALAQALLFRAEEIVLEVEYDDF